MSVISCTHHSKSIAFKYMYRRSMWAPASTQSKPQTSDTSIGCNLPQTPQQLLNPKPDPLIVVNMLFFIHSNNRSMQYQIIFISTLPYLLTI